MSEDRVVVTGLGLVCALGAGVEKAWSRLCAGDIGIEAFSLFDTEGYASSIAALAPDSPLGAARSRSERLGLVALNEALWMAKLEPAKVPTDLIVAASTGGMFETEEALTALHLDQGEHVDLASLACHPISAPADFMARVRGPFAASHTVCSACAGGAIALALAASRLRLGKARAVVAGGVDAMSRLTFAGFGALGALATSACRPFDRERRGLTLGEGAAFFVLEREGDARARGATIVAQLAGYAVGCEAYHITQPEPNGTLATQVMQKALRDAGVVPASLAYISAHGTGTQQNDTMEASAIERVLGPDARAVAVSSQKGQIGHTLSAAGAIEACFAVLALRNGVAPITGGLIDPDGVAALRLVRGMAERVDGDAVLTNSFGFGGTDASLVFVRNSDALARPRTPAARIVVTGAVGRSSFAEARRAPGPSFDDATVQPPTQPGPVHDVHERLDRARARRFDRASEIAALLCADALAAASCGALAHVGVVVGSAFGSTEAAAAFFARVKTRGARFAAPAEFPNLVPSSSAANASIYNRLGGPSLTVADLGTTPFAVLAIAFDLVADAQADAVAAVSLEAQSRLVEVALAKACGVPGTGPRGEGGGALLIEREHHATARGARALAVVEGAGSWREGANAPQWCRPPRSARPNVVSLFDDATTLAMIASLGWRDVPLIVVREGWHEAVGALGLSHAAHRLASDLCDEVLVVGWAPERFGAALLSQPSLPNAHPLRAEA